MGNIYTIYLRQPSERFRADWERYDCRIDPLYNKGCFGSTGCHSSNILNTKHEKRFKERIDRLCFMQGGSKNTKIQYITPPIRKVKKIRDRLIIKWDSKWNEQNQRPLKYEYGLPLTTPLAQKLNEDVKKEKPTDELYQHFRSRTEPVDKSDYLIMRYEDYKNRMYRKHGNGIFVNHNHETFEHFEYINDSEGFIEDAISAPSIWCSMLCNDKTCKRRTKRSNKLEIKQKDICQSAKLKCKRC